MASDEKFNVLMEIIARKGSLNVETVICWETTKSMAQVIYGYRRSESTTHQLPNFVPTLAKSTIYKNYMAAARDTDGRSPKYCRACAALQTASRNALRRHGWVTEVTITQKNTREVT